MKYRLFPNELGCFVLFDDSGELQSTWMDGPGDARLAKHDPDDAMHPALAASLHRYFAGEAADFTDAPTPHGSDFTRRCWEACRTIPRGQTRSYADLAEMAGGSRTAARAAGQAMRNNPLPIIVPCHRVVASDGSLHGFAGSQDAGSPELRLKHALLALEGAMMPSPI